MKKFVLAIIALSFSALEFTMAADTLDGCGLGWQVTDKKTYTATATRLTTNAFVPPTFGMTTGTMGCDKLIVGQNDREAADYVATNYEQLKVELAKGNSEYVDALAGAFGCSAMSSEVGHKLQNNYDRVVAPAHNSLELFQNIRTEIQGVCI